MRVTDRDQATRDRLAEAPGRAIASSKAECDIAEVLHAHDGIVWADALELATALLAPGGVVADLVREGQAEALEDLAEHWERHGNKWHQILARNAAPFQYARLLRDRTAALRASRPGATP